MFAAKVQQFTHFGWAAYASRGAKSALANTNGATAGSAGASSASSAAGGSQWQAAGKAFSTLANTSPAATQSQTSTDDDQDRKRHAQRKLPSSALRKGDALHRQLRRNSTSGGRTLEALSLQSAAVRWQLRRAFTTTAQSTPSTPAVHGKDLPSAPVHHRRYSASAIEIGRPESPFIQHSSTFLLPSLDLADQSILKTVVEELHRLMQLSSDLVRDDVRRIVNVYRAQPVVDCEAHTKVFQALLHIRRPGYSVVEAFAVFDEMPSRNMLWNAETIQLAIKALVERESEIAMEVRYLAGMPGSQRPAWISEQSHLSTWNTDNKPNRDVVDGLARLAAEQPMQRALELYLVHSPSLDATTADALLEGCILQQQRAPEARPYLEIGAKVISCLERSTTAAPSAMTYAHLLTIQRASGDREAVIRTFQKFEEARDGATLDAASALDSLLVGSTLDQARITATPRQLMHAGVIGTLFDADEPEAGLIWLEKLLANNDDAGHRAYMEIIVGFARTGDAVTATRWLNKIASTQQPSESLYLALADALLTEFSGQADAAPAVNATLLDISEVSRQYGFLFHAHRWWPVAVQATLDHMEAAPDRRGLLQQLANVHEILAEDYRRGHATEPNAETTPGLSIRLARAFAQEDMLEHAAKVYDDLVRRTWASLTTQTGSDANAEILAARREQLRETALEITGISQDGQSQARSADSLSLQSTLTVCRALWAIDLRPAGALAQLAATKYIELKMQGKSAELNVSDWAILLDACAVALISHTSEATHLRVFDSLVDDAARAGAEIEKTPTFAWTASTISSVLAPDFAGPLLGRLLRREPIVASPATATAASENGVSDLSQMQSPVLTNWTPPSPVLASPAEGYEASLSHADPTRPVFDELLSQHLLNFAVKQRDSALVATEQALRNGRTPHPVALAKLIEALSTDPGRNARGVRRAQVERMYVTAHQGLALISDDVGDATRMNAWRAVEDSMLIAQAHLGALDKVATHRDRLFAAGFVPSAEAYATMILNMRDTTDDATVAVEMYREACGYGVLPNLMLYNTLIARLSRARRAAEALMYFHEMRTNGVEPDSVTYGSVINACCKIGDVEQARRLFEEMVNSPRYVPHHPPYNTMMQLFQSKGDRPSALEFFDRLLKARVSPTDHTYRLLIDIYGAIDPVDPASARDVFRMLAQDQRVAVQGIHWAALITMYGVKLRDCDSVLHLFDSIATHKSVPSATIPQPDPLVYEALFHALSACQRHDLVDQYRRRMVDEGVPMTAYTANALIKAYGSVGDVESARQVFASLQDPDGGVAGHSAHHRNPRSHPEPSRSRMLPSDHVYREPSTYEALMRVEMEAGHPERAVTLYEQAVKRAFPFGVLDRLRRIL